MLAHVLILSSLMVVVTVTIHFFGVTALLAVFPRRSLLMAPQQRLARQAITILAIVFGLVALHGVEIWVYALVYIALGEFHDLEAALYFSASTFSTVGYGDIVMDTEWRLMSAIESVNGFVLIGWSTAVLVEVIGRMRTLEARWSEEEKDEES